MQQLKTLVLHILLPHTCAHCGADLPFGKTALLCRACQAKLLPVSYPLCLRCGLPLPDGGAHCRHCLGVKADGYKCRIIRSALHLTPELKSAVHSFKYRYKPGMAAYLAQYMQLAYLRHPELHGADALVPVPMHEKRLAERGFNQSAALAQELARAVKIPVADALLSKTSPTAQQAKLNRGQRQKNLLNSFAAAPGAKGLEVLLIDDICTTGATLEECARALRRAGAGRVRALTLARELPPARKPAAPDTAGDMDP
ncbi:MAG: ComF family protein [Elusimicrobiaceae bacterium]|nr:ComF family protein [Elusimicrobiaceae bacterium]